MTRTGLIISNDIIIMQSFDDGIAHIAHIWTLTSTLLIPWYEKNIWRR